MTLLKEKILLYEKVMINMIKMRMINFYSVKTKSCMFIVVFLITIGMLNMINSERGSLTSFDAFRTAPIFSTASNGNDTIIGTPAINPTSPTSNDPTNVTVLIADTDGIQNTTLFWQYNTINTTVFNTTMTSVKKLVVDENEFSRTGYLTDTGEERETETERKFGDYIYEAKNGEAITEINLRVKTQVLSKLVYVRVDSKNFTTSEWKPEQENGTKDGTDHLGDVDYFSTKLVAGYRIYAVTYKKQNGAPVADPDFDYLHIYREEYLGTIPAANQPTFVSYNITAFDMLNNSATSNTYTFLMDWAPEITIYDVPIVIKGTEDYILNVSVTDLDGVGTIDDSSVITYYRLEGMNEWTAVTLNQEYEHIPTNTAFYNGTILSSNLENLETNLNIVVNASDEWGREGSSGIQTIILDSLHPRVAKINIEGGVVGVENVTLISSEVNITAEFEDPAGISSVSIYYSIPNGTSPIEKEMINTTLKGPEESPVNFSVTLPATNETTFVEYFFETTDYFGNTGTTSINIYYADGTAPLLETLLLSPSHISNITDVTILFNATDYSGLEDSIVWYSIDAGTTWNTIVASPIKYNDYIDYQKPYIAEDLPFLIQDNNTSRLSLEVARGGLVDSAVLTVEFTHELSTDLRMWLTLNDNRRFLIFDRKPGPMVNTFTIDLFALGLNQSDFDSRNFTLEIQDYSDLFSGFVNKFEIKLKHHSIPLGYRFLVTIPQTGNDTHVLYFITLTDKVWNSENTSTYQYYSDGLPPTINIQTIVSPLDLSRGNSIQIEVNVTDTGGVLGVDIYYKFTESADWSVASMSFDPQTNMYVFDIPIPTANGTLIYKVRAFDFSGLASETPIDTIEFFNGRPGVSKGIDIGPIIIIGGILLVLGVGGAGAVYLIRKRISTSAVESIETMELSETGEPPE